MTTLAFAEPDEPEKPRKSKAAQPKTAKAQAGKRNVNGEGNIRERSDGRWEGRAYVITTDGREVRRSVYGKSWEDVHEKLTKMQADTMSGKRVASSSQTVGEYLEYWLQEHARHRVRDTTYASYRWLVEKYLVPLFGKKKLTALRPADIRRGFFQLKQTCQCCAKGKDQAREDRAKKLRAARAGKAPRKNARPIEGARCCAKTPRECCRDVVSDGTVRYLHRVLRAALQDAVTEDEILTENVAKKLRMDHKYRPAFKAWKADDATKFLGAIRDDRLYALYAVALSLGLRRGEALGLRWWDVDLINGVIRVEHGLHRVDGELQLGLVKTDGSLREIPVPKSLLPVLDAHRKAQEAERAGHLAELAAPDKKKECAAAIEAWDKGFVFTTMLGTPIEPRNVNRHFDALCAKSGVRRIRFHDLRHSCASLLWSQGVPLEQIQDILGHADPRTTKVIYVDVAEELQREAVDKLGFLFEERGE
ncbi:site-specific integrase [Kribbella sp. NPDC049584]|uniref:tyrosine-type recombinase/integrase n=1 Tax=Kribbella sp. NPDC049584 TaxID=3154833 RepID=UPI003444F7EF